MWNPLKKKTVLQTSSALITSEQISEEQKKAKILNDFNEIHGPILSRLKFCPITGRALKWNAKVVETRPFDIQTGRGVFAVITEISAEGPYNKCIYTYYQHSKMLEIWNGNASKHEHFDFSSPEGWRQV